MKILLNGVDRELKPGITITELVSGLELAGRRVAVEVNGRIVPAGEHKEHALDEGDRVELISAIGGG